MRVKAKLRFVTLQADRTAQEYDGFAEIGAGIVIGYAANDYDLRIEIDGDTVTVVRTGKDGYRLTLCERQTGSFDTGGFSLPVATEKLRIKREDGCIRLWAKYFLGTDKQNGTTVTVKATY